MILLPSKRYSILSILIFLLLGFTFSCSEVTLSNPEDDSELISKQISIQMSDNDLNQGKDTRIDTIDLLLFIRDPEGQRSYSFVSTITPTTAPDGKIDPIKQTIKMKDRSTIDVHLFANVHQELVNSGLLSEGLSVDQVEKMFESPLHSDLKRLNNSDHSLPMYGIHKNALKTSSAITIPIKLVRCIAKVGVQLEEVTNFKLRECYVFYPAVQGRIVPDESAIKLIAPGEYKTTQPSLPLNFTGGAPDESVAIIHKTDVSSIENLYIYENKTWTANGVDRATTRIVVGGIVDGSSQLTYFLLKSTANSFSTFMRNYKYIVRIGTITTSGFATPREAANSELTDDALEIDAIITSDWNEGAMEDGNIEIN